MCTCSVFINILHIALTGSGVLPPSSSTTLLAPTSSASHVGPTTSHSLPKLTPHTLPTLTSSASGNPPLVISWEGGDGERGSGRERGEERVTDATQDEEVSLSSMPLSLPGENRYSMTVHPTFHENVV